MLLLVGKQIGNMNSQCISQCLYSVERWVCATSLDAAHVTAGKAALVGEGFLRKACQLAQCFYAFTKFLSEGELHTSDFLLVYSYWPRTNRDIPLGTE